MLALQADASWGDRFDDRLVRTRQLPLPLVARPRSIAIFVMVAFSWTWVIELVGRSRIDGPLKLEELGPLLIVASFGPTIGAVVAVVSEHGWSGIRLLFKLLGPIRGHWQTWVLAGYVLVPAAFVSLLIFCGGRFGDAASEGALLVFLPLVALFSIIGGPLGEELGWRGVLLPALLSRWSPIKAGVVVGLVWALWHAPLWTFSDFIAKLPAATFVPLYVVSLVAMSSIMTVLHLRSAGSVFMAMVAHAALNTVLLPFESLDDDGLLSVPTAWPLTLTVVFSAIVVVFVHRKVMTHRSQ
jgi:uncharacterized protein